MTATDAGTTPLTTLFVCTGNICRSALAHHYLGQALEDTHPDAFRVVSAGTGWYEGLEVPDDLVAVVPAVAGRLAGHAPHYLNLGDIRAADLVLTATEEHRRRVLAEAPFALKRTFTILEFAEIVADRQLRPGLDRIAWLTAISEAARHRGSYTAADIPDPYRRGQAAYEDMRDLLLPALDVLVWAAGLAPAGGPVESTGQ